MTKQELAKLTTIEKWNAGYRQHPDSKEWLPRNEVVAIVAAKKAARANREG
jgi:hypothetical protein